MIRTRLRVRLVCALLLAPIGVSAQQADFDAQVQHGIALRDANQSEAALQHLRQVWENTRYPRALAQVAVTEQTLGRWTDADRHFREVLALTTHPWVQQNRARIEQSLTTVGEHLGEFEVSGVPMGTELWIDDQRVATMPIAGQLRVTVGTHSLELRARGFVSLRRTVVITAGVPTRETVALVREGTTDPTMPTAPPTVLLPAGDPWRTQRVFGWVGVGIGTLALGGGIAGVIIQDDLSGSFDATCGANGAYDSDACRRRGGDLGRVSALMGVGFGVAGAFALTSLVLFITVPPRTTVSHSAMRCAPGMASIGCEWTF